MTDGAPRTRVCPQCREAFQLAATGRPATYCSTRCRKAAWEAERLRKAVAAAVEAERARSNRGDETPFRGNETAPVDGDECPYCRDVVAGLLDHLRVCPDGPGA